MPTRYTPEKEIKKTIALDFDGVFNMYVGWAGEDNLYESRSGLEEFLIELHDMGYTSIYIMSCRCPVKISEWIKEKGLDKYIKKVTQDKIPADVYLDDRGINFNGNFQDALAAIRNFKPHWKV